MRQIKLENYKNEEKMSITFSKQIKGTTKYLRATFNSFMITAKSSCEDCVYLKTNVATRQHERRLQK